MPRQPRNSLNLRARISLGVPGVAIAVVFFAFTEIDASRQLTDDGEVDATADVGFERRDFDKRVGREVAGPEVTEGVHFFAELEEALFWADFACAPFRPSDGPEYDGIGVFGR